MESEELYGKQTSFVVSIGGAGKSMTTISADAEEALALSHRLHDMLSALEARCFPPEIKEVDPRRLGNEVEAEDVRHVPIGSVIRETRQRLDTGLGRLETILQRL